MAIIVRPTRRPRVNRSSATARYVIVTRARGRKLLDREAKKRFKMSGAEFARKYRAGEIPDPDRADVIRVAMLLPFAGE